MSAHNESRINYVQYISGPENMNEEIEQETDKWFSALSPNERFRARYAYDILKNKKDWLAEDYIGRPKKFLMDKPFKLVISEESGTTLTWRYIMHNNDVVLYSVTLSILSRGTQKLDMADVRIIAFFYNTEGTKKPIPRKSDTQDLMCLGQGLTPDYKQISLTKEESYDTRPGRTGGWELNAALDLGFFLNDTRWPK